MTFQHWKTQTSRGIMTPRSSKLKAIDKTFESYDLAKKSGATTKAQVALFNALIE